MQNIKAIINNRSMNILHQNNKIEDERNCRNQTYYPFGGKYLVPNILSRKKTATQSNYNGKVYFGVEEKLFRDSATTPNPLPMKIT